MPTYFRMDGLEHNTRTVPPYDGVGGTIVTSPVRTGTYSLEIQVVAGTAELRYDIPSNNDVCTMSFYIRFASLPTTNVRLARINTGASSSPNLFFQGDTTGRFAVAFGGLAQVEGGPSSVVAGIWYLVDLEGNTSANPHSVKAKIDGGTEFSQTFVNAADDCIGFNLGASTAATYTAHYDDWACSITPGDYPIGPHSFPVTTPLVQTSLIRR